jgi:hypothetical protein
MGSTAELSWIADQWWKLLRDSRPSEETSSMSSSLGIVLDAPASIKGWAAFCEANGVVFSPNTVGQNVFYRGQVEVTLDKEGLVRKKGGCPNWETAKPPDSFSGITVSSYVGRNLDGIGDLARAVLATFAGHLESASPELEHAVIDLPRSFEIEQPEFLESTDHPDAWALDGRSMSARVAAGDAVIRTDGALPVLEIGGVRRGTFLTLDAAMAFAGRCDWAWWEGPAPEERVPPKGLIG